MPVITLNGISFGAILLASISQITKNKAPKSIEIGTTFLLSLPINNLTKLGITKPIQPIVPLIETETAVSTVAIIIMIIVVKL